MAKSSKSSKRPIPAKPAARPTSGVAKKTEVRNTPIPKVAAATPAATAKNPRVVTREMIEFRAFEIWQHHGGNEFDNWIRAERELRGQGARERETFPIAALPVTPRSDRTFTRCRANR